MTDEELMSEAEWLGHTAEAFSVAAMELFESLRVLSECVESLERLCRAESG